MLQAELNRLEDLLSQSRAERDEIGIKYNAVSERVRYTWGDNFSSLIQQGKESFLQE